MSEEGQVKTYAMGAAIKAKSPDAIQHARGDGV